MKEYKVVLYLCKPENVSEEEMDEAIADTVYNLGGELIDSKEYEEIGDYESSRGG